MIVSASRRTDIPNYYSEWFFNRLQEGFLYVRNPMNFHQISEIRLSPDVVDCIVFWTKNPEPMIDRLDEIKTYPYYFQFTLTGYGTEIEGNVPHKKESMIPIFQRLSKKIGKERVIWRYDPILFTSLYTPEYHQKAFWQIADQLKGYTDKCVISFVDTYAKNRRVLESLNLLHLDEQQYLCFAKALSETAHKNHITLASCAERIDLSACGIEHNCCIDQKLIEKITGCNIVADKDKNQRDACGCIESIEIGTYNTCKNNCIYCYANDYQEHTAHHDIAYKPSSPLLCSELMEGDRISQRKVYSVKQNQTSFL